MIDVVVVIIDETRNVYYLSPNNFDLRKGDRVVFEIEGILYCGKVLRENYKEKKKNLVLPLNQVVRIASNTDLVEVNKNKDLALQALEYAKKICIKSKLEMNFVDAFFTLDKSQLVFTFVADNRVDFRELAKKLAQKYKTRIELRQIGVRDKAKKIGGIGPCGLFLCCNSFLTDFDSVSINMAKNQLLALNPTKINGMCGRLLCCLGYEDDLYTELKKKMPSVGSIVKTPDGEGKVVSVDIFNKKYKVSFSENDTREYYQEDSNDRVK